jgi:hypothetical protein
MAEPPKKLFENFVHRSDKISRRRRKIKFLDRKGGRARSSFRERQRNFFLKILRLKTDGDRV